MNNTNAQLFLQAQGEMARIEGMKAANKQAEQYEHLPQPCDQSDFERSAEIIEGFAQQFYFGEEERL